MAPIFSPCCLANGTRSRHARHRAVVVHDLADDGGRVRDPASRARSTLASVWPARTSTPPSRAISGKTWPGETMSLGALGRIDGGRDGARAIERRNAGRDALARFDRLGERGPVARPVRAHHAIRAAAFALVACVSVRQMRPRPCLAMKLIASGVAICAGMTRSPSFSRSSASTSTTMRPFCMSSTISSMSATERSWISRRACATGPGIRGETP